MRSSLFFLLWQVRLLSDTSVPEYVYKQLKLPALKRTAIRRFIETNTFAGIDSEGSNKKLYLKSHFLLYDTLREPVNYILNIPREQFAMFYNLRPYDKKTDFFYKNRLFYIPYMAVKKAFRYA